MPINSNSILPSLVVARHTSENIKKCKKSVDKLNSKLMSSNLISKAKIKLMKIYSIEEEEAHRKMTKKSMEERKTLIKVSEEILEIDDKNKLL